MTTNWGIYRKQYTSSVLFSVEQQADQKQVQRRRILAAVPLSGIVRLLGSH
jgi:hypothetical protein